MEVKVVMISSTINFCSMDKMSVNVTCQVKLLIPNLGY